MANPKSFTGLCASGLKCAARLFTKSLKIGILHLSWGTFYFLKIVMKAVKIFNVLFLGPQGSGKGTQAKIVAEELGMRHISSGDALRQTAKRNTELGRYLRRQMATGRLTPIAKLLEVFEQVIGRVPKRQGIIFDGFARQITETKLFLRRLKKLGRDIALVVMIDIPESETVKRLSKRLQCDRCHRAYVAGGRLAAGRPCPKCGGRLFRRVDDEPGAIRKRLREYRRGTVPVIKFFEKRGLVVRIRGTQPVPAVSADISRAFKASGLTR